MPSVASLSGPKITRAEEHAIRVELARHNLIDFCRLMAPPSFIWGAAQVAICDFCQKTIDGQGKGQVNLPPRSGKSIISSIYLPAWFIGQHPTKKIILLTGNLLLTSQFLEQLVTILQSDAYKEVFPHVEILDASISRINYRDRRQERGERGRLTCMSISRAAQGVGANLLLADDLISEKDAQSKIVKDKIWERWTSGLVTRLDPIWSAQLCIATRWSRDDPLGRMVAQDYESETGKPWKVFKIPAIVDADQAARINKVAFADPIFRADLAQGRVQRLETGGTCSPERMTAAFVQRQKDSLTPEQFAALYQQTPSPESGTIFHRDMFKPIGKDMMREMKASIQYALMTIDLAFKAEEKSDYSAMLHVGVVPHVTKRAGQEYIQNTIVLLGALQDRIEPASMAKVIRNRYREWGPREVVIEDAASGSMVIQQLRRAGFPIRAFNPRKMPKGRNAKVERANLAALLITGQAIYFDERDATVQAAVQSFLEFPRSDHDDLTDCLVTAILYLRARNDFAPSFETWTDEIETLRREFDDEDDEPYVPRSYFEKPVLERSNTNPYTMTTAERQRYLREQARRHEPRKVTPFDPRHGIVFDDD